MASGKSENLRKENIEKKVDTIEIPKRNETTWRIGMALWMLFGVFIFFYSTMFPHNGKTYEVTEMALGCIIMFVVFPVFLYVIRKKKYDEICADVEGYKRKKAETQVRQAELKKQKQEEAEQKKIRAAQPKILKCAKCGSEDILVSFVDIGSRTRATSEVRKKNAITRAGNKAGRAGMIVATGGLWAITPKKSDYKAVYKGTTGTSQIKMAVCQKCGKSWRVWN